ncbi:MAG: Asp-tRNA(Asn)/Glu-tRNA(Gln) amidotransferase subunit GatC [Candidatus Sungbacteria bacterium]|uniref:Aspartyl/glutamyl-tRNA(Asn/Gln) amidotransferase subunit C n=1 Tax=Candidatus Sungiibacteriota bacterium TaxID=2750080 RepID=A0A933DR66_9BACT|nr:Asp-tRNA(Asn)/Glu-tRNA(Gln) amidotransferase subunit GatC [Candidatus Sungbacteria bacterium]
MPIDKKTLKHIAALGRLGLREPEEAKLERDLAEILAYVEKLQALETGNVEPTAQVGGLENVWREDERVAVVPHDPKLLKEAFPKKKDGFLEVEAIFE